MSWKAADVDILAFLAGLDDGPRYRITQPGNRIQALRTWRRAMRVWRLSRASLAQDSEG